MTFVLQLLVILFVVACAAYVWVDLFDTIDRARDGELLEFPLTGDWSEHDVALTLAEIEAL